MSIIVKSVVDSQDWFSSCFSPTFYPLILFISFFLCFSLPLEELSKITSYNYSTEVSTFQSEISGGKFMFILLKIIFLYAHIVNCYAAILKGRH